MTCCPTQVPRVDEYVEAQHRDDTGRVYLGRLVVAESRNLDDTVTQTNSAQYLIECSNGGVPSSDRIVFRTLWLGCERPKKEYVVKADDVLQDTSCIPLIAGRLGLPMIAEGTDLVAECRTDLPVPVRRGACIVGHGLRSHRSRIRYPGRAPWRVDPSGRMEVALVRTSRHRRSLRDRVSASLIAPWHRTR